MTIFSQTGDHLLIAVLSEDFSMSNHDTMTPLLNTPWVDASGKKLSVRTLPGLRPELIKILNKTYPGVINPTLQALLATCCGLADTELGAIDFTGCCFPEEPCSVFHPCLTLAIDDAGRRWIAELGNKDLPGPVWCVFPDPQVAMHISDDLHTFLARLHQQAHRGETLAWLQDLSTTAHAVWTHRRVLALRPYRAYDSDAEIRAWLSSLPSDAYVYDLRRSSTVRGWPYGVAGPSARLYRCGRLPVFAVAASPTEGWRVGHPETTAPIHPIAAQSLALELPNRLTGRRRPRGRPAATAPGSPAGGTATTRRATRPGTPRNRSPLHPRAVLAAA
jgi:hypothetical protein